jgi:hypothetical protein
LIIPAVLAVVATALLVPRFSRSNKALKAVGIFLGVLLLGAIVWGFLMVNVEGGIFDQTFWD